MVSMHVHQLISRRLIATRARLVLPGPTPESAFASLLASFFQKHHSQQGIPMTDTTHTNSRRIVIFDTTLRDGEQSPGASMNLTEKMEVAQALLALGVDVHRGRLPHRLARRFRGRAARSPARSAACRSAAWPAAATTTSTAPGRPSGTPSSRGSTSSSPPAPSIASSSSRWTRRASSAMPWPACKRAAGYCPNVEFSPEDAARTETDFLCQVVEAAIAAGATTVNIPDTVGYATPSHMHHVIQTLRNRVPNIDKAVISVHCHNDLGMAVANSLAAVEAGAGQIECTINGLGERAGNCSLEEVVMALRTRNDYYHAHTNVNTRRLVPTSRLVANVTGIQVQRNKAIVGQNAFAHEAGIHQDGMLKERTTYEIMRPEDVGFATTELGAGQAQRPRRPGQPHQGPGLFARQRADPAGLRDVQGPGRQEEGDLRRRHRRPDRAGDAAGARAVEFCLLQCHQRHGPDPQRASAAASRAERGCRPTWWAATGRSTRSSWRSRT